MGKTEAVIFDWAGTTVDYGCFAPVNAFAEAFAEFDIQPTMDEIRKPMGMLKIDHIKAMLHMERIARLWCERYGKTASEKDVQAIYSVFEERLLSSLETFANPKEKVLETVGALRQKGIQIGSTTGYTKAMMEIVMPAAKRQGYAPDACVTPEDVGGVGRPYPYMIFETMRKLSVSSVQNVVKVGDTVSDIQEGVNAGVCSVGIVDGSSEMGLTEAEFAALNAGEKHAVRETVRQRFLDAGADYVIDDISGILELVEK